MEPHSVWTVTINTFLPINWSDPIESCSNLARTQYETSIPEWYLLSKNHASRYDIPNIPQRTWTYWLSNIESNNRLMDKAYFADKYLMKQYVENLTKHGFEYIHYASIVYDFVDDTEPSFEELSALKDTYGAFVVKPNNYCAVQMIVKKEDEMTPKLYNRIVSFKRNWIKRQYNHSHEPHYLLMTPHFFIEQHLNVNESKELIEYKFMVINYKAIFLYVMKKVKKVNKTRTYKNCYTVPEFEYLNIRYHLRGNKSIDIKQPSTKNMHRMIEFAEYFAKTERFKFVRVDLYEIDERVYFSEFTFTPARTTAIIAPIQFDYLLFDIVCNASQENIKAIRKFVAE